jgi:hypothetical protein
MLSRRTFLKRCAAASIGGSTLSVFAAGKAESLFDGKSLKGWHKPPKKISHGTGGQWTVENGILIGQQDPPGSGNGGMLLSDKHFGDFELEFEMNPDYGPDTGVFFRCTEEGWGFQYYVDYHEGGNVGHLRGEMPGAFAMKPFQIFAKKGSDGEPIAFTTTPDPRAQKWPGGVYEYSCTPEQWLKTWKIGAWNKGRLRCVGKYPQITTWVNDLKVCHWNGETSTMPEYNKEKVFGQLGSKGAIGLQIHGGKRAWPEGKVCRWRNITVREL